MKTNLITTLLSVVSLCLISVAPVLADTPAGNSNQAGKGEAAPIPPPDTSSVELKRIKALVGRWRSTTSMFGKENEEVFTEYKVTAGGSAVLETIFPGTPQEMVSVYYDDDHGKLAMTHYCMLRNRPHFTLVKSSKDEIALDVTKVEGVTSKDSPSMGKITLNIKDENNFSSTCAGGGDSEHEHAPMTMHYTRVR